MNPLIRYCPNGTIESKSYFIEDNKFHNEVGPVYIVYHSNGNIHYECYLLNNKFHNTKGPSRIWYCKKAEVKFKQYWINNKQLNITSDEEFIKYIKLLNIS